MSQTKVRLFNAPPLPMETIWCLWVASKENVPVPSPTEVHERVQKDPTFAAEVRGLFLRVIRSKIPVAENLFFVFLLEGVPIELREQMVRHRVGMKFGDRLGCDIAPELGSSSWWSQSMRILDMSKFADEGGFRVPESVRAKCRCWNPEEHGLDCPVEVFRGAVFSSQSAYRQMLAMGIPMEDARGVVPLAATHRISWGLNLATVQYIVGRRSCWLLQLGVWEPLIRGVIGELVEKVDPVFAELATPPCIAEEKFVGCPVKAEHERRIPGQDETPPCPLFLRHHRDEALTMAKAAEVQGLPDRWYEGPQGWTTANAVRFERYLEARKAFGNFWNRDVDSGELRNAAQRS